MHGLHDLPNWYEKVCPEGVEHVSDLLRVLEQWPGCGPLWFRGEEARYDTSLVPRIDRNRRSFTPLKTGSRITAEEASEVKKAQQWFSSTGAEDPDLAAFIPKLRDDDSNWLPLAQHYDFATRLLDITQDPRIALFFAAQPPPKELSKEADGYVFFFFHKNYCCQTRRQAEIRRNEIEIPLPDKWEDLFEDTKNHPVQIHQDSLYLLEPPIPNTRMRAQRAAFMWWDRVGPAFFKQATGIVKIRGSAKANILRQLAEQHITRETLFPY